jgi:hypothetical protein
MFRRSGRMVRRGLFARLTGQAASQLIEANRLFAAGEYVRAALLFEQLALSARRPRNAAHLFVQAGRAHLLAGKVGQAMLFFRRGLNLLAERRRWRSAHHLGQSVIQELRERGHTQQADELTAWLNGQPAPELDEGEPDVPIARQPVAPVRPPRLPTKCPSCGGAVDPRDVEWVDDSTVECDYCGSLIRAEEA